MTATLVPPQVDLNPVKTASYNVATQTLPFLVNRAIRITPDEVAV